MIIKSNNGASFTSQEFQLYMTEIGVKHQKITPHWPQANSAAENFMKPLKKLCVQHIQKRGTGSKNYICFC